MRKAIFFTDGDLPYKTGGGCPVHMYGILRLLQINNFDVTIVPCNYTVEHIKTEVISFLKEQNAEVLLLPDLKRRKRTRLYYLRSFIKPRLESFTGYKIEKITTILEHEKVKNADLIYGFNWECVPILSQADAPTILSLVDLVDEFIHRKENVFKAYRGLNKIRTFIKNRDFHGLSNKLYEGLESVDYIIQHAYQHYEKLVLKGFSDIVYIPHPLIKPFEVEKPTPDRKELRLLILGSLKGVASKAGFRYFFEEVAPLIQNTSLENKLNIVIGGHGAPDNYLLEKCKEYHSFVKFKGFLENLEPHVKDSHALLVVIPIGHGFRTRIAEMMGVGLPVIAHSANSDGMPELQNNYNALLSDKPSDMVSDMKRLMEDETLLSKLHENGRQTFHEKISMESARSKYAEVINKVL